MASRQQLDLVIFTIVAIVLGTLIVITPPAADVTASSGTDLVPCPGRRLSHVGATHQAVFGTDHEDESSHCFLLPRRLYSQQQWCLSVTANECTPERFITNCYDPGECPAGYTLVSASVNSFLTGSVCAVESQGVCCN